MSTIDIASEFSSIDDVIVALESLPGINDDRPQRQAAPEQMERQYMVGLTTIQQVAALTQA